METKKLYQKWFNKITKHLLTQNAKCETSDNRCMYRNDGLKCAIGACIPDYAYTPDMENITVLSDRFWTLLDDCALNRDYKSLSVHEQALFRTFLRSLQMVHDCGATHKWKNSLKEISKVHNLKLPKLLDD